MRREIKAVVFDWGGVLAADSREEVINHIAGSFGIMPKRAEALLSQYIPRLDSGQMASKEMWKRFAEKAGKPLPKNWATLWSEPYKNNYSVNRRMLEIAVALKKKGVKIGVLSNTIPEHDLPQKQEIYQTIFDGNVVLSYQAGVRKPQPEAYEKILEMLGAQPHEAVHIDDKNAHVKGAQDFGMNAIKFKNPGQVESELKKLGLF